LHGFIGGKGVVRMKVEEFLEAVREGLQAESIQDADRIVRVVVGALKSSLPAETETAIGRLLPEELAAGWEQVEPLPEEMFERSEMYLEEGPPGKHSAETPTITAG
jgi:uncharacterized protein (DUF2267 family)